MLAVLALFGTLINGVWGMLQVDTFNVGIPLWRIYLAIGAMSCSFIILNVLLGVGGSGRNYRSGSGGKKKISNERKHDEK